MNNFFSGFERQPETSEAVDKVQNDSNNSFLKRDNNEEYPNWVLTAKRPEFYKKIYSYVLNLEQFKKNSIKNDASINKKTYKINKTEVCKHFGKSKSFLKNHTKVESFIDGRNETLTELFEARTLDIVSPSKRTTIAIEQREKEHYKNKYEELLSIKLEDVLNGELIIGQQNALHQIAQLKLELSSKLKMIVELENANNHLQQQLHSLQQKIFNNSVTKSV